MKILANKNTRDSDAYFRFRNSHMTVTKSDFVKKRIIDSFDFSQKKFLEVGCGPGIVSALLAGAFPSSEWHASDMNAHTIATNNNRGPLLKNLFFHTLDIGDSDSVADFKDQFGLFDAIFSVDCIHHVERYGSFIRNVHLLLAPRGKYYCIEPNPYNPYIFLQHSLTEGERNFNPGRFLSNVKPYFRVCEKTYFLIVPEFIRRPPIFLKTLESLFVNMPTLNGSVGLVLQKI